MKPLYALTVAASIAVAPGLAAAADATRSGFSVGARVAYAWPFGNIAGDTTVAGVTFTNKLADQVDRMIPIWIDATLRLGGGFEVGPYASYGWISGKNGAGDAKDWRAGAQLNYRLAPAGGFLPWVGVGAGWEWVKENDSPATGPNGDVSGLELLVQGGGEFRLGSNFGLGPFVALSLGRFSSGDAFDSAKNGGITVDKAWHEWVQIGVKGSFDF
jgi:hypothetical protein